MTPRDRLRCAAALTACALSALLGMPQALAQAPATDYPPPGSSIRYVVPFPAGGLTDVMARLVGQQLAERWKVGVVIDNRPGGGGLIGADAVAKAPADGQTLLAITLTHAANASLFKGRSPYELQRDLRPVALLAGSPMLVVVPAASAIHDIQALISTARTKPLNAGSSGNGTPPHLTLALFNQLNGTSVQHVPYKGGAPSITDLIGGQLDVIFSNLPESIAQVKAGKLRALAITSAQRHPLLPEVPTTQEAGLPRLRVDNWTAVAAPAGMSDAAVNKLGAELLAIMALPAVAEKAAAQGFRIDARGPQDALAFVNAEVERWGQVIQAAGLRAD